MGYLFRINKQQAGVNNTIVDWSNSINCTYNHGFINSIQDTTTTQREITSIPSPFARIELVKEAFAKVLGGSIANLSIEEITNRLHGNSIYHKMVSDSLDVGQIFFNYPSMKDKVEIIVWNINDINKLLNSNIPAHKIYGKSLNMFLNQDGMGKDPYNFSKMRNIYILRYIGPDQSSMHIIGATSPATLFFSTANSESKISKHLCFGQDYAFDDSYASLDKRDPEYLKYIFTLKYSIPSFDNEFPEVSEYLNAVFCVLNDELKRDINNIQELCNPENTPNGTYIDSTFNPLTISATSSQEYIVEVNGHSIHNKIVKLSGNTDFEIKATKQISSEKIPLVLPVQNSSTYENLRYYGNNFGRNTVVPYYDSNPLVSRVLPGINIAHPYLTISDFLEDKIIKFPWDFNSTEYFDGNYISLRGENSTYMLPLTKSFFDYFKVEDLKSKSKISGKNLLEIKELASGVQVTLRIPIVGGEVEYNRIYTFDVRAEKQNNKGAIILAE